MSKVVLNTFYMNPNKGDKERIANLVSYIATRDGVINPNNYNHESTKKQEKLIHEITGVLPHVEESALFKHYCLFPTKENASRLITTGLNELNENGEMIRDASKLLSYIAERPGVLKNEVKEVDHGLFTLDGNCLSITDEQAKMIESGSNVYHHAISIKLDEAKYIGMDNKEAWEGLVRRNIVQFAKGSNIKLDDLGFVAAVHESKVSFHVHLMQYSKSNDRSMYFSEHSLNTIRKNLTKDVYKNHIHEYGNIRNEFFKTQITNKHLEKIDSQLVEDLRVTLELHNGRKFYGYLTQEDKLKVAKTLGNVFRANEDLKIKLDKYLDSQVKYKGLFEKEEGKELKLRSEVYKELLNPSKNQKSTFHNQLIDLILDGSYSTSLEIDNEIEHLEVQQSDYEAYMQSTLDDDNLNKRIHNELRMQEHELFEASVKSQKLKHAKPKKISQHRFEALLRDINILASNSSNTHLRNKLFDPVLFKDSEVTNIMSEVTEYQKINKLHLTRNDEYLMSRFMQVNYYIKFKEQKIMNNFNMFDGTIDLPRELETDIIFLREYVYDHKSFGFDKIPVTMQHKFNQVIKDIIKHNPEVERSLNQTVMELEQLYLKNGKECNLEELRNKVLFGTFDNKTISQNRFMSALFSNQLFDMETNELNEQVLLFSKAKMLKNITNPKRESDRITWGSDNFIILQHQGYFDKVETKEEFDSLVKKLNQATKLKDSCLKKQKQVLYTRYINKQLKSVSSNRNLMLSQFREYHKDDYVQDTAIIKQVRSYINSKKYGDYKSCRTQLSNPYFLNNLTVEDKSKALLKMELLLNRYEKTTSEKVKCEINLRLKTICKKSHDYEKSVHRVSDHSLLHLLSAVLNHKEDEAKYNNRIKKKKFRFKKQKQINR